MGETKVLDKLEKTWQRANGLAYFTPTSAYNLRKFYTNNDTCQFLFLTNILQTKKKFFSG